MTSLAGRRIVLGVCGGIAAYKAIDVCRQLVDAGAHVVVVMTDGATKFVGEVTFSALASEPVQRSLFGGDDPIPHTRLGQSADLVLVAPATARLISAYAAGYSHDLLTNVLLATRAPVLVCPAMHTEMWEHPAVQDNMAILRARGVHVVDPEEGRLAGGDVGAGRLAAPATIVDAVRSVLALDPDPLDVSQQSDVAERSDMVGLEVLVSAGGTREPIDPVRFIGNRSSGKQGHALAEVALARGARVTLVTTTQLPTSEGIATVHVATARELHAAVMEHAPRADVVVMAAAVADFTPVMVADEKLKKRDGIPLLELQRTVDVLAELGSRKPDTQTLVGFAAETRDVRRNAEQKLRAKGADMLVVNDVAAPGVGFEFDTNEVLILCADGADRNVALTDKRSVAGAIWDAVLSIRSAPSGASSSGDTK